MPGLKPAARAAALAFILIALPVLASPTAVDSLAAAERAFAKQSVEHGMRDAFLANLADDGIVFYPRAVNGKALWQARPPLPGTLAWEPEYAEVATSGDLGFTTGPWQFTAAQAAEPVAFGHFISVWRRDAGGPWRVAADIGIGHEQPEHGVGSGSFHAGSAAKGAKPSAAQHDVARDPKSLDRSASGNGRPARAMLMQVGAADLRFNTDGKPPAIGLTPSAVRIDSLTDGRRVMFHPQGAGASAAHDLIYSYGIAELVPEKGAPDSCAYLNVWRLGKEHRFELALSVMNPLTPAP